MSGLDYKLTGGVYHPDRARGSPGSAGCPCRIGQRGTALGLQRAATLNQSIGKNALDCLLTCHFAPIGSNILDVVLSRFAKLSGNCTIIVSVPNRGVVSGLQGHSGY
ncbi:hypothetical protein PTTG_28967 [Puccinia triticina 1-1 BBBD Race 1]|uniref:Uncharacterized protein n=1 Tax=Puccinia triticina (isolate 1-1 / race 1 (BBBD)) TaxID=630390 RepID=A0A180G7G8_PUCT1|nr:hypothetical protein PTTG_28967 [Puccinia triticina 1-1 BBBD Race 1]